MKLSNFIQNHNIKDDLDQLKSFKEETINTIQTFAEKSEIPTKNSQLLNDSNFISRLY